MNRHRETNDLGPSGTMTHVRNHTLSAQLAPVTVRLTDESKEMDDVVVPRFYERIRSGEVINNPCGSVKTLQLYTGGGSYYGSYKANPQYINTVSGSGSITGFWLTYWPCPRMSVSIPDIGTSEAVAKTKALASVDKAPYNVSEDIAQIARTIALIREPLFGLETLSQAFQKEVRGLVTRRERSRIRSRAHAIANVYVKYKWGFLPYVRSIHTALNSLAAAAPRYDTVHSAHGTLVQKTGKMSDVYQQGSPTNNWRFKRSAEAERSTRATVQYRTNPPSKEWARKYGLRVKDVPRLMWELYPYSFMVDQLVNVSDVISGFVNLSDPNVEILGGTVSHTTVTRQTRSVSGQTHPSWNVSIVPDVELYESTVYSRTLWQPDVTDLLESAILPRDLTSNITFTLDSLALILNRLK